MDPETVEVPVDLVRAAHSVIAQITNSQVPAVELAKIIIGLEKCMPAPKEFPKPVESES